METWKLNLCLFGEGGGDGGGAAASGGGEAAAAGAQSAAPEGATSGGGDARTAEERAAAFEQLIKGEYAQEFSQRTQGIINERFKDHKQLQTRLEQMQPIFDALATKYGESDHGKLMAAIEADESFYQEAADEQGLSVEQYKRMRELERKAQLFDEAEAQRQRMDNERKAYAVWDAQSTQLKQIYPDFDFAQQCQDPVNGQKFIRLLGQGVDVKTAYEVLNHDRLIGGALQTAVSQAQMRTVQTIQAQGMRPIENGAGGSVATKMTKIDPANMTKQERADYARRALQGERIDFSK